MARKTRGRRADGVRLADRVRHAVDDGATTVEEIHKAIADLPLEVLERLDVFQDAVKDVKKLQDTSIGAIYDAIRRVNHEVTGLARDMLRHAPARKPARKPAKGGGAKKAAAKKPAKGKAAARPAAGRRAAA